MLRVGRGPALVQFDKIESRNLKQFRETPTGRVEPSGLLHEAVIAHSDLRREKDGTDY
jgi:hypothetical protein